MKTLNITFNKRVVNGHDEMGNPKYENKEIIAHNCLIAPITEPLSVKENQAMERGKNQVRVHLPKTFNEDISKSSFVWNNQTFEVDTDPVEFMKENTPTTWNRYFRAEAINE